MAFDDLALKKNLISLAVGKALIDINSRRYSEVSRYLGEKYGVDISDCYEHPGDLRETLRELYGNSSGFMIGAIRQNLADFPYDEEVAKFLNALSG